MSLRNYLLFFEIDPQTRHPPLQEILCFASMAFQIKSLGPLKFVDEFHWNFVLRITAATLYQISSIYELWSKFVDLKFVTFIAIRIDTVNCLTIAQTVNSSPVWRVTVTSEFNSIAHTVYDKLPSGDAFYFGERFCHLGTNLGNFSVNGYRIFAGSWQLDMQ